MKCTQAPPNAGSPAAAALSSVHRPSAWYTHPLVHGIKEDPSVLFGDGIV